MNRPINSTNYEADAIIVLSLVSLACTTTHLYMVSDTATTIAQPNYNEIMAGNIKALASTDSIMSGVMMMEAGGN